MLRLALLSLISIFLVSCAGKPVKVVSLEECTSDGEALQCVTKGKAPSTRVEQFKDSSGYVCHTPEEDQVFWNACLLQRTSP